MNRIFALVLTLFCASIESKHFDLAICAIFQDDAKYLPEWIEFHKKQGVQHFYLYNNLSTDNPDQILASYIKAGLVEIILWPFSYTQHNDWTQIQCDAYTDCIAKHKKSVKWLAILDTDEFLFCPDGTNLRKLLKEYTKYGSVSAYWMMYGTSNLVVPPGGKLTEYLVYRAPDQYHAHLTMKTIVQTKYFKQIINPHYVITKGAKGNFGIDNKILRINHYWSRDLDFFYHVKLPRRERWYNEVESQIKMESEMNEIYDPILSSVRQ